MLESWFFCPDWMARARVNPVAVLRPDSRSNIAGVKNFAASERDVSENKGPATCISFHIWKTGRICPWPGWSGSCPVYRSHHGIRADHFCAHSSGRGCGSDNRFQNQTGLFLSLGSWLYFSFCSQEQYTRHRAVSSIQCLIKAFLDIYHSSVPAMGSPWWCPVNGPSDSEGAW